jgi:hypothetical protein
MHEPRRRPAFAAVLMLAFAGLGAAAHAVEFDEKLKAPAMASAATLHSQAKSFAAKLATLRASEPSQIVTSNSLARQQFDLTWQVQRAIDERQPLNDMADMGFVAHEDGSYSIDMAAHPEWQELPESFNVLVLPGNLENTVVGLTQRGFRPEDLQKFRNYVANQNWKANSARESAPVALGFSRAVRKYDKLKLAVPDSLVVSYMYQRKRVFSDVQRAWAQGLLKQFDAQRQRILISLAQELKFSTLWAPEDTKAVIADLLAQVRLPDFESRVAEEVKGVAP